MQSAQLMISTCDVQERKPARGRAAHLNLLQGKPDFPVLTIVSDDDELPALARSQHVTDLHCQRMTFRQAELG